MKTDGSGENPKGVRLLLSSAEFFFSPAVDCRLSHKPSPLFASRMRPRDETSSSLEGGEETPEPEEVPSRFANLGGTRPSRHPRQEDRCCAQCCVDLLINTRCTESTIWALSALLGLLVMAAQTGPIFLLDWVHIREPRPLNITRLGRPVFGGEERGPLEVPFEYNAGYFGVCRRRLPLNVSSEGIPPEVEQMIPALAPESCVWNPIYAGEDLGEFSVATNAVLARLLIPTILHCFGAILTAIGLVFSVLGHFGRSWKTVCAAIFYVLGGLVVLVGVLQMICVVDDEMTPRMKPNPAGEPTAFGFNYGMSFMCAALSFLPMQLCVWLEVTAFFRRFSSPLEKTRVVPGLGQLLSQLSVVRAGRTLQLGRSGGGISGGLMGQGSTGVSVNFAARRRESRASRDLGVLGEQVIPVRRTSSNAQLLFV